MVLMKITACPAKQKSSHISVDGTIKKKGIRMLRHKKGIFKKSVFIVQK